MYVEKKTAAGLYTATAGNMSLYSNAVVIAESDFYIQSTVKTIGSNESYFFEGQNATLELYGDFYQVGTNTYFRSKYSSSKVVFYNEEPHVSFDRIGDYSCLPQIFLSNSTGELYLDTNIYRLTLLCDATIYGRDLSVNYINTNGNTVRVIYADISTMNESKQLNAQQKIAKTTVTY